MPRMGNFHRMTVLTLAVLMFATICTPALAYIDGGTGSYILQVVFAALFGASFALKSTFQNLKLAIAAKRRHGVNKNDSAGV
jgi:hypothetical protein